MARGGKHKDREGPERRCIATGESGSPERLIRFVLGPDGAAVPGCRGQAARPGRLADSRPGTGGEGRQKAPVLAGVPETGGGTE